MTSVRRDSSTDQGYLNYALYRMTTSTTPTRLPTNLPIPNRRCFIPSHLPCGNQPTLSSTLFLDHWSNFQLPTLTRFGIFFCFYCVSIFVRNASYLPAATAAITTSPVTIQPDSLVLVTIAPTYDNPTTPRPSPVDDALRPGATQYHHYHHCYPPNPALLDSTYLLRFLHPCTRFLSLSILPIISSAPLSRAPVSFSRLCVCTNG